MCVGGKDRNSLTDQLCLSVVWQAGMVSVGKGMGGWEEEEEEEEEERLYLQLEGGRKGLGRQFSR